VEREKEKERAKRWAEESNWLFCTSPKKVLNMLSCTKGKKNHTQYTLHPLPVQLDLVDYTQVPTWD